MDYEGTFLLDSGFLTDGMSTSAYGSSEKKYGYNQLHSMQQTTMAESSLQPLTIDYSPLTMNSPSQPEDDTDSSPSPPRPSPSTSTAPPPPPKKVNHSGRKRSIIFEQAEAEFQRKEFLERNRIAASKCRQKKKKWVKNLENNYESLSTHNRHLRSTVMLLQEEVNALKSEMLSRNGLCSCTDMRNYIQRTYNTVDPLKTVTDTEYTLPFPYSLAPPLSSIPVSSSIMAKHCTSPSYTLPSYLTE